MQSVVHQVVHRLPDAVDVDLGHYPRGHVDPAGNARGLCPQASACRGLFK
jgi:hypothetical protein